MKLNKDLENLKSDIITIADTLVSRLVEEFTEGIEAQFTHLPALAEIDEEEFADFLIEVLCEKIQYSHREALTAIRGCKDRS